MQLRVDSSDGADGDLVTTDHIQQRLEENIRFYQGQRKRVAKSSSPKEIQEVSRFEAVADDFQVLHDGYDLYQANLVSNRPLIGRFVTLIKKALRKLLSPVLLRQLTYNGAVTRTLTWLLRRGDKHEIHLNELRKQQEELSQTYAALRQRLDLHADLLRLQNKRTLLPAAQDASSCFRSSGKEWYPRPILGPSTIGRYATNQKALTAVLEVLPLLQQDQVIAYLTSYYETGKQRYGSDWVFADITTVLVAIADLMRPRNYLEVGVFHGRSMAVLAARCPDCELYGFDLWIDNYADLANPGPAYVREQLGRVAHRGPVDLISGDSHQTLPRFFAEHPDLDFDLITVDGDHTYEGATQDLRDVLPHLRVGGFVVFDDIAYPGSEHLSRVWAEVVAANSDFTTWQFSELGNGVALGMRFR